MTVDLLPYATAVVPVPTLVPWAEGQRTLGQDLAVVEDPDGRWALLLGRFLLGYPSEQTRAAYRNDLTAWRAFTLTLGAEPVSASRGHVDAWVLHLTGVYATATVARKISTLAAFYRWLVDEDVLVRTPVRGRRPRATDEPTSTGCTEREAGLLLDAAEADGLRSYVLVSLLYLLGLRISEALTAPVDGLGWERGYRTITVTRKGGARARLPLPPVLAHTVDALVGERTCGPVLVTATGRQLDRKSAWKILRRLGRQAGLQQAGSLHPHDLRHAFATSALDAGAALITVQDALGHSDPRTTRRYDRVRGRIDRHPGSTLASRVAVHRHAE